MDYTYPQVQRDAAPRLLSGSSGDRDLERRHRRTPRRPRFATDEEHDGRRRDRDQQAALHGLLNKLRDLRLPILTVQRLGAVGSNAPMSEEPPESPA